MLWCVRGYDVQDHRVSAVLALDSATWLRPGAL